MPCEDDLVRGSIIQDSILLFRFHPFLFLETVKNKKRVVAILNHTTHREGSVAGASCQPPQGAVSGAHFRELG